MTARFARWRHEIRERRLVPHGPRGATPGIVTAEDLIDLVLIASLFPFRADRLRSALRATFDALDSRQFQSARWVTAGNDLVPLLYDAAFLAEPSEQADQGPG